MLHVRIPDWANRLFASDQLGGRFIGALFLVLLTFVLWAEHELVGRFEVLFDFLPTCLRLLTPTSWLAVLITGTTACLLFLLAWLGGYLLALTAGVFAVSSYNSLRLIANLIDNCMDFFYIVPIVLTIALVHTPISAAAWRNELSPVWVSLAPLIVSVFLLSGYQVYECCYKAITTPDDRARYLIGALYMKPAKWFGHPFERLITLNRRIDFDIRGYGGALYRALHLSFVAVVIVEMVVPPIYQPIYQAISSSIPVNDGLLFGVGGRVNQLRQSLLHLEQIAGMVWALALFDLVAQGCLRRWVAWRFDRHYNRGLK